MRTTLTLDDDVASRLKALAQQRRSSFKEVVNGVLRRGLAAQDLPRGDQAPFSVATFRSALRPGVDALRLNQLADQLEIDRLSDSSP